jgi:hypothetical protein
MVGSLLDSGRSKANEILNRSTPNGVEGEKTSKKFVDENSSLAVNSSETKTSLNSGGIQPRNFYPANPRTSHLLCLATPSRPSDADVIFSGRQRPVQTYSRNQPSRLLGRPYPTSTPFSVAKKESPRTVLGALSNSFNAKNESTKTEENVTSSSPVPKLFKLPSVVVESYEIGFPNQGICPKL